MLAYINAVAGKVVHQSAVCATLGALKQRHVGKKSPGVLKVLDAARWRNHLRRSRRGDAV